MCIVSDQFLFADIGLLVREVVVVMMIGDASSFVLYYLERSDDFVGGTSCRICGGME